MIFFTVMRTDGVHQGKVVINFDFVLFSILLLLWLLAATLIKCIVTFNQTKLNQTAYKRERASNRNQKADQISKVIHLMEFNGSKEMEHKTYVQCLPENVNSNVAQI